MNEVQTENLLEPDGGVGIATSSMEQAQNPNGIFGLTGSMLNNEETSQKSSQHLQKRRYALSKRTLLDFGETPFMFVDKTS